MTQPQNPSITGCSSCGEVHSPNDPCANGSGARVGMVLDGKYELVRLLGQGGMGEVYEGRHIKIGRPVAVKFLLAHYAKHTEVARRFENEARAAGAVAHENIAAVYDVGAMPDATQYLVMEYLDGEDLDHLLRREGRLSLTRAADLICQACLGLEVVHRQGIVHRDLKPANMFVTKRANRTDLVKLLDFGIAKLRRAEGDAASTKTGMALGTAYYMSPEQARGDRDIGTASDVYALGVILYEVLSGKRPHEGDSLLQILHRVLTQAPTPLEEVVPGLPPAIYAIVQKAMASNPTDRFADVAELAAALNPYAAAVPGVPRQSHPGQPPTRVETSAGLRPSVSSTPPLSRGAFQPPHQALPVGSVVGVVHTAPSIPTNKAPVRMALGAGLLLVGVGAVFAAVMHNDRPATTAAAASSANVTSATPAAGLVAPVQPVIAVAPIETSVVTTPSVTEAPRRATASPAKAPPVKPAAKTAAELVGHDSPPPVVAPAPSPPPPPAAAPAPSCTIETSLDENAQPHFKKVCK